MSAVCIGRGGGEVRTRSTALLQSGVHVVQCRVAVATEVYTAPVAAALVDLKAATAPASCYAWLKHGGLPTLDEAGGDESLSTAVRPAALASQALKASDTLTVFSDAARIARRVPQLRAAHAAASNNALSASANLATALQSVQRAWEAARSVWSSAAATCERMAPEETSRISVGRITPNAVSLAADSFKDTVRTVSNGYGRAGRRRAVHGRCM